jgi:hypothetical protein
MTYNQIERGLFQTANGFLPGGSKLRQYNTHAHIPHKITPQKKQTKTKSDHKATQKWNVILQPMNAAYKKKIKSIPDTGLGDLLSCETSRLSPCLDNRFIVGG